MPEDDVIADKCDECGGKIWPRANAASTSHRCAPLDVMAVIGTQLVTTGKAYESTVRAVVVARERLITLIGDADRLHARYSELRQRHADISAVAAMWRHEAETIVPPVSVHERKVVV